MERTSRSSEAALHAARTASSWPAPPVAVVSLAVAMRFVTTRVTREAEARAAPGPPGGGRPGGAAPPLPAWRPSPSPRAWWRTSQAQGGGGHRRPAHGPAAGRGLPQPGPGRLPRRDRPRGPAACVAVGHALSPDRLRPRGAEALAGRETTAFRRRPGRPAGGGDGAHRRSADPPEVLGTLSLGFALDDALAARFRAVTESEVAFVHGRPSLAVHAASGGPGSASCTARR